MIYYPLPTLMLAGVIIKKLTKYTDKRGYLVETFREDTFPDR